MPGVNQYLNILSTANKGDYSSSELNAMLNYIHKNGKPKDYTAAINFIKSSKYATEDNKDDEKMIIDKETVKPLEIKGDNLPKHKLEPKQLLEESSYESTSDDNDNGLSVIDEEPPLLKKHKKSKSKIKHKVKIIPSKVNKMNVDISTKKQCSICGAKVKYPTRKAHLSTKKHKNVVQMLEDQRIELLVNQRIKEMNLGK